MTEVGLESLQWLTAVQHGAAGHFVPIDSNGFYERDGEQARFDQQPVEAQAMISACLEAYRARATNAGARKHAAPSNGFWAATI